MKKVHFTYKVIWILLIIAIWEVTTRIGLVNPYILPPFSGILQNLVGELQKGILPLQVLNSLKIVLLGFAVSIVVGVIVSACCMISKIMESLVRTICTVLNPLPGVALLPLFMLWFGLGNGVLIALIFHGVAWPLIENLLSAFHSVPKVYIEWAENIESTFWDKLRTVYLYYSIPYFLSGLRIGWGRAWRALIAGEMVFGMIGTLGGLGYYIYKARSYGRMEDVFGGIIIIIMIGLLVEEVLFKTLERHTIEKWGMSVGR